MNNDQLQIFKVGPRFILRHELDISTHQGFTIARFKTLEEAKEEAETYLLLYDIRLGLKVLCEYDETRANNKVVGKRLGTKKNRKKVSSN